jgi:hypothetical protein
MSSNVQTGVEIQVSAFSNEDLETYAAFQRRAFRKPFAVIDPAFIQTADQYRWKYRTPAGKALIARAYLSGTLVATAAAIPMLFRLKDRQVRVHQIVDLASSPEIRGRGVFRRCLAELLSRLGHDQPLYCFPNQQSRRSLEMAGFSMLERLDVWAAPALALRPAALPSKKQGFGLDLADLETFAWRFERRPRLAYTAIRASNSAMFVARRVSVWSVPLTMIMAYCPGLPEESTIVWKQGLSQSGATGITPVLWIGSAPPAADGFTRVPSRIVGRTFPVLVKAWPELNANMRAAEWDVL